MTDEDFRDAHRQERAADARHEEWRARGRQFWRWLTSRRAESWLFLVAGVLIGKFFF